MVQHLLNPTVFLLLLVGAALVTPVAGWVSHRKSWTTPRNAVLLGALGPFALAYWGVHNAVLATLGFDTVLSAAVVVLGAAAIGAAAAFWSAGPRRERRSE